MTLMSDTTHYCIHVTVSPRYLAEESSPTSDTFVFAYTVTLINRGLVAARLISRHWLITDGNGNVQEVRGLGVVGEQPSLQPGETYEYTSGCQLDTPVGIMRGSYQMTAEDGTTFEAEIPAFTLAIPRVLH